MLAAIAVVLPAMFYFASVAILGSCSGLRSSAWSWFLAAGASVFGLENRARTQRFLVHHGARPGFVWLVKVTTWVIGLASSYSGGLCALVHDGSRRPPRRALESERSSAFRSSYAVALICGMAFRRGVTAFVIAAGAVASAWRWPLIALLLADCFPLLAFLVVAAALLAVSWAWRTDWMLDRPAPGRWLRSVCSCRGVRTAFGLLHRLPRLGRARRRPDCAARGVGAASSIGRRPTETRTDSTAKPAATDPRRRRVPEPKQRGARPDPPGGGSTRLPFRAIRRNQHWSIVPSSRPWLSFARLVCSGARDRVSQAISPGAGTISSCSSAWPGISPKDRASNEATSAVR